jgi:Phage regulatory protein Rha (Phage_pRha)
VENPKMTALEIFEHDGELVVDSRLIAERLGIEHRSFLENIDTYQTQIEQAFGILRFETAKIDGPGRPPRYALLNEDQATFLMTLSRNTDEVIALKIELVQKFSKAKQLLRLLSGPTTTVLTHTTIYVKRLENMRDHSVDDHLWTTFREGAEVLLLVERSYRVPVDQMDLCDGSIGSHWSQFRQTQNWQRPVGSYEHIFRDRRGPRECKAYDVAELPHFKRWLREEYVTGHLPEYLVNKYGKRAVRQIYTEQNALNNQILELTEEKRTAPKQEELYKAFLAARADLIKEIEGQDI